MSRLKSVLIGNGVTIEFGGKEYLNNKIIKRALHNIKINNFPSEIYPKELKDWLLFLFSRIPNIIDGQYDDYAYTKEMNKSLLHFKGRYKSLKRETRVHDIGFEDYFLVHYLVCSREKIVNPERFNIKESLRTLFLDSIFNNGKVQKIHYNYPYKFVTFLRSFDNLFTTNYDYNIEKATGKNIFYLHGAFHFLSEVYNPESFRNKLSDSPINSTSVLEGYNHLYSNALTSYSGEDKKFALKMGSDANIAIEKFVKGFSTQPHIRKEIISWGDSDNQILKNMKESIQLKETDDNLSFDENKSLSTISNLSGQLSILGLSPYNDNHIFEAINNSNISEIQFYYYDYNETSIVKSLFTDKHILFTNVKELWES